MVHEDSGDARADARADALYFKLNNISYAGEEECSRASNTLLRSKTCETLLQKIPCNNF